MHEGSDPRIKILIVDDDTTIADILRDLISNKERSVDICYDGLTALGSIQKTFYDLIIADLVMPGAGGLEVLRSAKNANPDAIVIIITGYASLETAITAIKEGAYDYIRKPCKLEEIRIAVENAIDKIKLYRENKELVRKLQDAYNELLALKKDKDDRDERKANINFFSSNMPSLHYIYNADCLPRNHIDKLQALSSLKENGMLTENEFKECKRHLLQSLTYKG
jgi:DNA-binding response OmpR family regulator